jgi:hypothetical protein
MPLWISVSVGVAVVGVLYLAKWAILRRRPSVWAAVLYFVLALGLAVPVTWAFDPDWDNPHVKPIAIWVGTPVALLTVPACSFALDLAALSGAGRPRSWWWAVPELLIAVPAWLFGWTAFSVFVLGWVWF